MTGSIICGVDDSESAKGAVRVARRLSAQLGSQLVFVRVVERGTPDATIGAFAEQLQDMAEEATDVPGEALWLVDVGHPADRLVAAAVDEQASLIVVGSTGPRSSLLGSVSADVSRRAPCPVVVVTPGADRALLNGRREPRTNPGLFDDGYAGVAGSIRLGLTAASLPGDETEGPDTVGGIVRFGLGARTR
jgi:nucleotide-binding universal stress UspA family protein